ncbi:MULTISPECIES: glycosyltransferase family 2 protein [Microbacterium]|uniref:glycosyltransferase family 2 protein n=1 Tax=Microbacterium TaxID=33882 RepID=UPI00277DB2F3|nr:MULTISPECIES: glycosyltransferase family 2 protein [Microbacterium]MDQ1084724.1 biofilm PGA synthesis N-glycosyltransferase PgaC [Microbacterium sp. SORGH_AS_0344]MDQ1169999.1 biofilm PGA synthesis N-glycosyltransferase PgaC [Microbacterium proteolyticum]
MATSLRSRTHAPASPRRSSWEALPEVAPTRRSRSTRRRASTPVTGHDGSPTDPAERSGAAFLTAALPAAEESPVAVPGRRRRAARRTGGLVAALPAHNEEAGIAAAIEGLKNQTSPPDHIVVIADNCTDRTVEIARAHGAEVFITTGNTHKKAGALNQFLAEALLHLREDDLVLVQDADSALDPDFLEIARKNLRGKIGAVGGVFRGSEGGGFVGHLQRNEYARYARDVQRLNGKCLVVTGTAAVMKAGMLRQIGKARLAGQLPAGDGRGGVYDTSVLTEDNELTFAIRHLGYDVLSPAGCTLVTEIMPTWKDLWKQRLRWKRGAVENCVQYGLTRITWPYWGRQILTMLGCLITYIYLGTIVYALFFDSFSIQPFWLGVTAIFVIERIVTVRYRGWRYMLVAGLMYELIIDLFLQVVHTKAYLDALTRRRRDW